MKVAAFDFDGTLLHPTPTGEQISPEDVAAIDAWRSAGHLAISATGRSRSALAYGMRGAALTFDYRVLSNGGSATNGDNTELLFGYEVGGDILRETLAAFAHRDGLAVFGTTLGSVDGVFANNTGTDHSFTAHFEPMTEDDIDNHQLAVVPIWVPGNPRLRAEVVEWAERLGGVTVTQNQEYIDIMAPGRTKGAGVKELLEHIGLKRAEVELFTFGDSWNDISMHQLADISHSFPHSPKDVQAVTSRVIGSVADVLGDYI